MNPITDTSDRVSAPDGTVSININGTQRRLQAAPGVTLLKALADSGIFLPSACAGRGACGYCKVILANPTAPPLTEAEKNRLDSHEIAAGVRLACQLPLAAPMHISIAPGLLDDKGLACICTGIRPLTADISSFRFRLPARGALKYQPGQYLQMRIPSAAGREQEVYRSYSIASDPADCAFFELIIKAVPGGIGSTYCFQELRKGQVAHFNGPHGDFYLRGNDRPIIFIAGGSGMGPIKCMLHHMINTNSRRPCIFFFGARRTNDLFYLDLMDEFRDKLPDFRFVPSVAEPDGAMPKDGVHGLVTDAVAREIKDASGDEAYLCGSPDMINAAGAVLRQCGIKPDAVYFDKFA